MSGLGGGQRAMDATFLGRDGEAVGGSGSASRRGRRKSCGWSCPAECESGPGHVLLPWGLLARALPGGSCCCDLGTALPCCVLRLAEPWVPQDLT